MKKSLIALTSVVLLLILVGAMVLRFRQRQVWLSTSSPNGTYTMQLTGNKSRPIMPIWDNKARFDLFKNGQPILWDVNLDSYGVFDPTFAEEHPEHRWVSESVLRFGKKLSDSETKLDELILFNTTGKPMRYVRITSYDELFVFDFPPGAKLTLHIARPPSDGTWVGVEGMFADGEIVPYDGVDFRLPGSHTGPLTYCVWVQGPITRIASTKMDGYNADSTSGRPNVLRVEGCDSKPNQHMKPMSNKSLDASGGSVFLN
jgi:hypothetical protein